jgi:O-succinylbenzoate synthase
MRLWGFTLREIRMPLLVPFETSMERTTVRRIVLVEANVDGTTGWGECVAGETPAYSPETTETAWHVLRDFLWPLLKGKDFGSAADVWDMLEWVRGNQMAKAALESAIWDAESRQNNLPLWKLLGGQREEIASGVSIGIKSSLEELVRAVQVELEAGYQRVKIKIKPGTDVEPVRRLRKEFPSRMQRMRRLQP